MQILILLYELIRVAQQLMRPLYAYIHYYNFNIFHVLLLHTDSGWLIWSVYKFLR